MADDEPPVEQLPAAARFAPTAEDFAIPLEALADARLLALVEQRLRPEIVREHGLRRYAGELPHHLDPVDWRTGFLEVHDGGPPPELREAMHEHTPQALLRDLFRPELSLAPVALDYVELPLDPAVARPWRSCARRGSANRCRASSARSIWSPSCSDSGAASCASPGRRSCPTISRAVRSSSPSSLRSAHRGLSA